MLRLGLAGLVVLASLVAAPIAAAAPSPILVAPADGKQIPPPPGDVTFTVRGQVDESAGSLQIQLADADATVDSKGSFRSENGIAEYPLEQVEPGGDLYRATVPAADFQTYGDPNLYWQAYRRLPAGSCTDCFQESAEPWRFEILDPAGYGAFEPNDSAAAATVFGTVARNDCAFLEKRSDVDWYRYKGASRALDLRLRLVNDGDTDRWVALKSRKRESADMSVAIYRAKGVRKVASKHVAAGKSGVLKARLKAKVPYLIAFRHAGNGHRGAKPAADMAYSFRTNLLGDFSHAQGCS